MSFSLSHHDTFPQNTRIAVTGQFLSLHFVPPEKLNPSLPPFLCHVFLKHLLYQRQNLAYTWDSWYLPLSTIRPNHTLVPHIKLTEGFPTVFGYGGD